MCEKNWLSTALSFDACGIHTISEFMVYFLPATWNFGSDCHRMVCWVRILLAEKSQLCPLSFDDVFLILCRGCWCFWCLCFLVGVFYSWCFGVVFSAGGVLLVFCWWPFGSSVLLAEFGWCFGRVFVVVFCLWCFCCSSFITSRYVASTRLYLPGCLSPPCLTTHGFNMWNGTPISILFKWIRNVFYKCFLFYLGNVSNYVFYMSLFRNSTAPQLERVQQSSELWDSRPCRRPSRRWTPKFPNCKMASANRHRTQKGVSCERFT